MRVIVWVNLEILKHEIRAESFVSTAFFLNFRKILKSEYLNLIHFDCGGVECGAYFP